MGGGKDLHTVPPGTLAKIESEHRFAGAVNIPNYELLQVIGSGAFGIVCLARERLTDVKRAVKLLPKGEALRASRELAGVRRYQLAAHSHPHLIHVLTVGETEHCYYYVMEIADNCAARPEREYSAATLRVTLNRENHLAPLAALELVDQLADGVAQLHRWGLTHGDLKPDNVLIVAGQPKIADLSLVDGLDGGVRTAGTPAYMTPDGNADDVYALGKLLYEAVTGRPASAFPSLPAVLVAERSTQLNRALAIINRACHRDASRRYADIADLAQAVAVARRVKRSLRERWRSMGSRRQCAWVAVFLLASASLVFAVRATYRNRVAVVLQTHTFDDRTCKLFVNPVLVPAPSFPLARMNSIAVPCDKLACWALERPLRYFRLDARIHTNRPWGNAELGLTPNTNGMGRLVAKFIGQPHGLGLRTTLERTALDYNDIHRESAPAIGHLLPGLDYLVRIARTPGHHAVVLWPMAVTKLPPVVLTVPASEDEPPFTHLIVSGNTNDEHAAVEILNVELAEFTAPLRDVTESAPRFAASATATVPDLQADHTPPRDNLLAGPYFPYHCPIWMSIGSWAWWENRLPDRAPTRVVCAPFSSDERVSGRSGDAPLGGLQMLRFDGASYGDFVAELSFGFTSPPNPDRRDPFVLLSHSGVVGLAFRLQDKAKDGALWGGGYALEVNCDPSSETFGISLTRSGGFAIQGTDSVIEPVGDHRVLATTRVDGRDRELFGPSGARLLLSARGPHFHAEINGRPMLTAEDHEYKRGRIALLAQRMIGEFRELVVTPTP